MVVLEKVPTPMSGEVSLVLEVFVVVVQQLECLVLCLLSLLVVNLGEVEFHRLVSKAP